ncbi:MAG: hypothetical protein GY810_03485 [Aureispira sp.]|nr:hypothetical protein [Aureispira sp.]
MKITILSLMLLLIFSACQGTKTNSNEEKNDCPMNVEYSAWNSKIFVRDGKITYTRIIDQAQGVVAHDIVGNETILDNVELSEEQLKDLAQKVKDSGFLDLEKEVYGADENQRYYPYSIKVEMDCKTKEVLHRSNPEYEGAPEQFKIVEKAMFELTKK